MKKIDDIYYLDWCKGEEWLNRQLKEYEQLPSIYEIDFNRFDNYNTSNLYIIKSMKSYTWTINELPRNLKDNEKLIDFLKTDKRNHGELIYSEIYDNIYIHLNEINGDEIIIDF
jgi:predicted RNase H-like nuclease (RuvC/YqgF family)